MYIYSAFLLITLAGIIFVVNIVITHRHDVGSPTVSATSISTHLARVTSAEHAVSEAGVNGCRPISTHLSFHVRKFHLQMQNQIKFWGLSSGQLQRSYPDPAFAASPGGTGIRTWDILVVGRVLYHRAISPPHLQIHK